MEILCKRLKNEKRVLIIKIRSDHGKEFENARFELFCEKNGIKKEFSAPKTPQQNRVVERKNFKKWQELCYSISKFLKSFGEKL